MVSRRIEMDFYADWQELLREQLKKMGYHLPNNVDPSRIPLMYFNVKGRLVERKARTVVAAPDFPWPVDGRPLRAGLDALLKKIEAGDDLTPHLSTTIRKASYTDMLLLDWGIHHLHLGITGADGFVTRTGELLYVVLTNTACHLLTIGDHKSFCWRRMLDTIHENWPHLISRDRLNCLGVEYSPNDAEIRQLRDAGISYPIQMEDGTVYMSPGGGYASSKVSDKAAMTVLRSQKRFKELEAYVREKVGAMADFAAVYGHPFGKRLHFKLIFASDDGETFRIVETGSGMAFQIGN